MKAKKFLVVGALLIVSAVVFPGCVRKSTQTEAIEIDRPAPAFKLPDISGRRVSLDQYKGKIVLLDFWATWCGPCRMTMPVVENLQKEYSGTMVLLAINLQESPDVVKEYMRQQKINSQVLLDEEGSVATSYGAEAIPMQVLIDKSGTIRDIMTGFHPRMASRLRGEIEKLR